MRIHVAVMQCNGEISDRKDLPLETVRSTDIGNQLVTGFRMMLDENLPRVLESVVKIELPIFDDQSGMLQWHSL